MLTPQEVADHFLRTSRKGVYHMIERKQIPGVVRVGRRVLIRTDMLLSWLNRDERESER
jgi:excisionase family DNA binding protein